MKKIATLICLLIVLTNGFSQSVGIGTTSPHDKAVLDINSTGKGVLFPRMTTAQRNAISNPPDGLHIYNTDERGLNYYDSVYAIWNSYLDEFKTVIVHISNSAASLNFYDSFAGKKPASRYLVIINSGVTLAGLNPSDTGLIFSTMSDNAAITLRNYGFIGGAGGRGGNGRVLHTVDCFGFSFLGEDGKIGGHAIATRTGIIISVINYGFIAGGGGGGGSGGPGTPPNGYGGGGGGGAGTGPGSGGNGGYLHHYSSSFPPGCRTTAQSNPGTSGTIITGGGGGTGSASGGNGGSGGARGMPGLPGSDGMFAGGAAGKAIGGGSGNSLINAGGGQSIGTVD